MSKKKTESKARDIELVRAIAKLPSGPAPALSVAVISTPRSGSNLFVSTLAATGNFGISDPFFATRSEYFAPISLQSYLEFFAVETIVLDKYTSWVKNRLTSDSGVFVAKIHVNQVRYLASLGFDVLSHFDKSIYLYRNDLISQSYSLAKARKSSEYLLSEAPQIAGGRSQSADVLVADHEVVAQLAYLLDQLKWFEENLSRKVLASFAYEDFVASNDVYAEALRVLDLGEPQNPFSSPLLIQRTTQDENRIRDLKTFLAKVSSHA